VIQIINIVVRDRGLGKLQSPDSGKAIIFLANAQFFGQKPAAKNEKNVFIKLENGMHSV